MRDLLAFEVSDVESIDIPEGELSRFDAFVRARALLAKVEGAQS